MSKSNKVLNLALKTLRRVYKIFPKHWQLLWNNESLVYKITTEDFRVVVIRITSQKHRSLREIIDELTVLRLLQQGWAHVVQSIATPEWRDSEILYHQKQEYYLTVFSYVEWKKVQPYDLDWNEHFFQILWSSTGTIHTILAKHNNILSKNNRLHRHQESNIAQAHIFLAQDSDNREIMKRLLNLVTTIKKLPKNIKNYGIIHSDIRPMNYHYNNNTISYFDFDDMCHHWFIYDIAITAFHATEIYTSKKARTRFLQKFLQHILDGYAKTKAISPVEISILVDLMILRCLYVFVGYYKRIIIKQEDTWREKMEKRRNYILDFNTFVDTQTIQSFLSERSRLHLKRIKKPIRLQTA